MLIKNDLPVTPCEHCTSRRLCALLGMVEDEATELSPLLTYHTYQSRQTIFYEGKPCHGLYILCHGRAKLVRSSWAGHQLILRLVSSGDIIELSSLYNHRVHAATCDPLEPCQVGFLPRERFFNLLSTRPAMAEKLGNALSRELDAANTKLLASTFEGARERLAAALLQLGDRHGVPHPRGRLLVVTLTREELSELAGISMETAVRLLATFREESLISTDGKEIILLDPGRLARICHKAPLAS